MREAVTQHLDICLLTVCAHIVVLICCYALLLYKFCLAWVMLMEQACEWVCYFAMQCSTAVSALRASVRWEQQALHAQQASMNTLFHINLLKRVRIQYLWCFCRYMLLTLLFFQTTSIVACLSESRNVLLKARRRLS